ncbi:hypothetical protein D3C85_1546850 [compost metagenome]
MLESGEHAFHSLRLRGGLHELQLIAPDEESCRASALLQSVDQPVLGFQIMNHDHNQAVILLQDFLYLFKHTLRFAVTTASTANRDHLYPPFGVPAAEHRGHRHLCRSPYRV